MRPIAPPTWIVFAASSLEMRAHDAHFGVAVGAGNNEGSVDAERLVVLGDLVALGIVGIEVVLAVKTACSAITSSAHGKV
jgi:hypothetical protein